MAPCPCRLARPLLLVIATACGPVGIDSGVEDSGMGSPGILPIQPVPGSDIIVIQADALRKGSLSAYGHHRETFPRLSARPWFVVDGITATTSWTAPSAASLLTGLDIQDHGMHAFSTVAENRVDQATRAPTIASYLTAAGYAAGLFTGSGFVSSETGLGRGFEHEDGFVESPGHSNASDVVDGALAWMATIPRKTPLFVVLHVMDPHSPYSPEPEDRGVFAPPEEVYFDLDAPNEEQMPQIRQALASPDAETRRRATGILQAVYDEQLLGMDRALDRLLQGLDDLGRLERAYVVLTADHGETLNDRDDRTHGHGYGLWVEEVEIPLTILGPEQGTGWIRCPGSNLDILPTLMEAAGVEPMPGITGRPLQRGCRGSTTASLYFTDEGDRVGLLSARTDGTSLEWKCTIDQKTAWNLVADPGEKNPADPRGLPEVPALDARLEALARDVAAKVDDKPCIP